VHPFDFLAIGLAIGVLFLILGAGIRRHRRFGNRARYAIGGCGCLLVIGSIAIAGVVVLGGGSSCIAAC
jgi:hypothetical protein